MNNPPVPKKNIKTKTIKRYDPALSHSRSKGGLLPILVVVLVLILLGVLALIYVLPPKPTDSNLSQNNNTNYQAPANSDSSTTASQSDPTASWLAYTKASSTYIFGYDPSWKIQEQGQVVTLEIAPNSQITFYFSTTTKSLNDYLADLDKVSAVAYEGKPSIQIRTSTPFTTGVIKGVQRVQTNLAADLEQNATYLSYNNKIFSITMSSPKITPELQNIYALFLSTVRFPLASETGSQTTSTSTSSSPATTSPSTSSTQQKIYTNTKFNFQLQYPATSSPQQSADSIIFTNGKYKLTITGVKGAVPSLIKYQPNGAKISGQISIAGKDAVKLFTAKATGSNNPYTQYVLPINDSSWIKIEYFGQDDVAKAFEAIIATIKFIK